MFGGFVRFDDELKPIPTSNGISCKNKCGRLVASNFTRLLRMNEFCCTNCGRSDGVSHSVDCEVGICREPSTQSTTADSEAIGPISSNNALSKLSCLLASPPRVDYDIDSVTALSIAKRICQTNGLPMIDDKHFLLVYSRFSKGSYIPSVATGRFFYAIFKKIYSYIQPQIMDNINVSRYFFVLKNTKVSSHYRFKSVVGQGSFGIVHRVVHKVSGHERVCKSIPKGSASIPAAQLETEIRIIAQLDHMNVVRMFEYFEDDTHVHLILENCKNGDLLGMIKESTKSHKPIQIEVIRCIVRQILAALTFMSSHRIIHKDLKPENVMLIKPGGNSILPVVKIIDFGLSEMFLPDQTTSSTVAGTAFYMAPEIFRPPFTSKCDVWSCGVMTFFMITGFLPFFGATVGEVKSNVLYRRLQWPTCFAGTKTPIDISDQTKDFVEKLLEKDYKLRIDASAALSHPWMAIDMKSKTFFNMSVALNMRHFSKLSVLKRCVINLIAHAWEFNEIDSIREVFRDLDKRNCGYVDVPDLAGTLTSVGLTMKEAWAAARSLDLSSADKLTLTAITAGCITPLLNSDKRIIRTAYQAFDPDRKGVITLLSMWEVLMGHKCAVRSSYAPMSFSDFSKMVMKEIDMEPISSSGKSQMAPDRSTASTAISDSCNMQISYSSFQKWLLSQANTSLN